MRETDYKIKNHTVKYLENHGFRYSEKMSCSEETVYEYKFPAYKWNDKITIDGRLLVIQETGDVRVDVLDHSDMSYYAPWYYDNSGVHDKLIDKIRENVNEVLKRFEVTKNES